MMTVSLILIGLGIAAIIGFLKQFGILSGKGFIFAIAGAAAVFGIIIFNKYRLKKANENFKKREDELAEQENILKELEKEIDLSDKEVFEAEAALKSEKGAHKKAILHIEAEKEKDIQKRKDEINNMSIDELLVES
jgi:cell division protein FtsL